ncbi:uncharacterized protein LOC122451175 isoform X2 [Cervus canadensis]|uniref:uncharacterized protein LOC122451175 isoform X2 n=1 Tax=Cervus canadensis TaxID=1574408 RepID=UPI001C9E68B9|nr:uncharacterized protein LOC122451175 isoform X2 [Cervus canadensis]
MAPAGHCHRWAGTEGERRVAAGREQEGVRGGAIFLYGDVIYSGGKKFRQALKSHAFQALVPLLFHLADSCPEKAKLTFLRCAILLKWEFRKELFRKLAWGHGPGAENDIFIYMVESNFNSYHQFLMQALVYLDSPNRRLKLTAMKFIGRCGHCPIHVKPQSGREAWVRQLGTCPLSLPASLSGPHPPPCRGHPAGLLQQSLLLPEEGRREDSQEILRDAQAGPGLHEPQVLQALLQRRRRAVAVRHDLLSQPRAADPCSWFCCVVLCFLVLY